jgi:hypothetical protein
VLLLQALLLLTLAFARPPTFLHSFALKQCAVSELLLPPNLVWGRSAVGVVGAVAVLALVTRWLGNRVGKGARASGGVPSFMPYRQS